ncbi:hypothetical protein LRS06_12700 [Hymenobacter sp. J193]|uniref:hypothetical protein n=1 Tax=Hymenobacter sp. J193 TaxID=2898429 RepID=UPI002151DBAD|nr:hypothetical protein [Hymenobacter sp. J193]MCR5888607.1 hypothetical protein [Hymenobacter sp. J193]
MRCCLVLLLLLNYLLVVGAGLVRRPDDQLRTQVAHPYQHSAQCQQQHYLRLDCFERCNGSQKGWHPRTAHDSPVHLLSLLKGIDTHVLLAETLPETIQAMYYAAVQHPCRPTAAVPTGIRAAIDAPPRRG